MTIHEGVLYVANSNPPQGVQRFDAGTGVNTGHFVHRSSMLARAT